MATLPGSYAAPRGRLCFAELDGRAAGCVVIREYADGVREMKRLHVEPEFRVQRVGRDLALVAITTADSLGYRCILIDTLPAMRIAVRLYRELGFTDAPAYYPTAVEGTMFLSLDLENWDEGQVNNDLLTHLFVLLCV